MADPLRALVLHLRRTVLLVAGLLARALDAIRARAAQVVPAVSVKERRYDERDGVTGSWTNAATPPLKLAAYDAWAEGTFDILSPLRADVVATAEYFETEYVSAQQRLKERHDDTDRTVHA